MDNRITQAERDALAELWATDKHAYAEAVTTYVDPVYLTLDLAATFMPTEEWSFDQGIPRRVFKGKYNVQQIVPGQITLGQQISVRDQTVSYNIDILAAKAAYNTLQTEHGGPAYTPETVRSDVQKALAEKILLRGWNALANIWTTGNAAALTIPGSASSNFIDAGGPLTSSALDAAIDHVNYWSGGVRAIVGTDVALAPLTTFGQYRLISGANTDNFVTLDGRPAGTFNNVSPFGRNFGGVETYRGVSNIVRIPQIFDETVFPKRPLLPNDYILVIGENIGTFVTYGGPQFKEFIDNEPTPPYWNYETYVQFGMMLTNVMGVTKIAVTSTIP